MSMGKFLFISVLGVSPVMAISSNSWIMLWILLEMSSMAFIMMIIDKTNFSKENSMKYFLVQASASTIMLMGILSQEFNMISSNLLTFMTPSAIIMIAMLIKLAAAPFHTWMPTISKDMDWEMIALMATWQKIIPLMILMKNNPWSAIILVAMISMFIGTISQFNMTSTKLIMVLSSIAHVGWMMMLMKTNNNLPLVYLAIYMMISIPIMLLFKKINLRNMLQQTTKNFKLYISMLILSLAGIPPLMGFLPKWMVLSNFSQKTKSIMSLSIMVILATINFFIYIRLTSSPLMNQNPNSMLKNNKIYSNKMMNFMNLIMPLLIIFYPK